MQHPAPQKRSQGECLLVFPPVWEVAAPYLAGPALAAYLKSNGHPATVLDANQKFWLHFKNREKASEIHRQCSEEAPQLQLLLDEAVAADWAATMDEDQFTKWLGQAQLSSPLYKLLVRRFGGFWKVNNSDIENTLGYHDEYFSDISHSFKALDSNDLRAYVMDDGDNPWRVFAREQVLPVIEDIKPSVLGLSIIAVNQAVPALAIAIEARRAFPKLCILLGGAWVTQLYKKLASLEWFSDLSLLLVPYQGEMILAEIVNAVGGGTIDQSFYDSVFSLLDKAYSDPSRYHVPLSQLPTPDFHDLNLSAYSEPGHLPLMASRGCYWARCTFCSYPLLEPWYEIRPKDKLARDISTIVNEYDVNHIPFADSIISVPVSVTIANNIILSNRNVSWGGFARLEINFTKEVLSKLAYSGCSVLHWGLETGSKRIQNLLQKDINLDIAAQVLEIAFSLGIHNRVLIMYGFPGETSDDIGESLDFLEANFNFIGSISFSRLTVELGTPLYKRNYSLHKGQLDITNISLGFMFNSISSMTISDYAGNISQLSTRAAALNKFS